MRTRPKPYAWLVTTAQPPVSTRDARRERGDFPTPPELVGRVLDHTLPHVRARRDRASRRSDLWRRPFPGRGGRADPGGRGDPVCCTASTGTNRRSTPPAGRWLRPGWAARRARSCSTTSVRIAGPRRPSTSWSGTRRSGHRWPTATTPVTGRRRTPISRPRCSTSPCGSPGPTAAGSGWCCRSRCWRPVMPLRCGPGSTPWPNGSGRGGPVISSSTPASWSARSRSNGGCSLRGTPRRRGPRRSRPRWPCPSSASLAHGRHARRSGPGHRQLPGSVLRPRRHRVRPRRRPAPHHQRADRSGRLPLGSTVRPVRGRALSVAPGAARRAGALAAAVGRSVARAQGARGQPGPGDRSRRRPRRLVAARRPGAHGATRRHRRRHRDRGRADLAGGHVLGVAPRRRHRSIGDGDPAGAALAGRAALAGGEPSPCRRPTSAYRRRRRRGVWPRRAGRLRPSRATENSCSWWTGLLPGRRAGLPESTSS